MNEVLDETGDAMPLAAREAAADVVVRAAHEIVHVALDSILAFPRPNISVVTTLPCPAGAEGDIEYAGKIEGEIDPIMGHGMFGIEMQISPDCRTSNPDVRLLSPDSEIFLHGKSGIILGRGEKPLHVYSVSGKFHWELDGASGRCAVSGQLSYVQTPGDGEFTGRMCEELTHVIL